MKILVVDDEKTLVKGMKFNLENEGYEVECAYDGTSALELAREGRFDLILLDDDAGDGRAGGLHENTGIFQHSHYHAHRQE